MMERRSSERCSHSIMILAWYILILCCLVEIRYCQSQKLVPEEVEALKVIGSKLKKTWNFSVDPCSGDEGWKTGTDPSNHNIVNNVNCTCTATSCHVIAVELKGLNLTGTLPDEFANLTSLSTIDLTRNYLKGSIPAKWASLPLVNLSLLGNQINGSIPKELGSITTLLKITVENNLLQGPIPEELGELANLNELFLSANYLTGELPEKLSKLKNLTDFRIDGNPISGKIPSFMENWTNLQRLDMQGTLMEGPFPQSFSKLKSLTELRVTDWKGGDGKFPPLENMNMEELVLRNLSISGRLPDFLKTMTKLRVLDLSFNNLSGPIPSSFIALSDIQFMYLSNNQLTGSIPDWILKSSEHLDISYNSFSGFPAPSRCDGGTINLVSSYSSSNDNKIAGCLRRNLPCSEKAKNYHLFINCGGRAVTIEGDIYEDDASPLGTTIYQESKNWAYSSTGDFIGNEHAQYIANNVTVLNMSNPELYTTARLSPLSLRYYGLCLQKGNYNVTLYFAEIMFTDDQTYFSDGRRFFDVSIQGKKVLRDFNIAQKANGTGKVLNKSFSIHVDGTLEVHFQWAGKGTNAIPVRSVYGPLISAISVTPEFKPNLFENKLPAGAIAGIIVAACVVGALITTLIWFCFIKKDPRSDELRGLELQTGYFTLKQIKAATRNFDVANKIGEGGFGSVYKGVLPDGTMIAVKQLSSKSKQGNREFINEIGMISAVQHPNLVKLYGCCIEGNQLLLIYEYMENNSLARALFGPESYRLNLDWNTRREICIGISRGLVYLHEESRLKIVHRDIKATNVLLDKDLNAKISDFGLAKLDEEENTHISTRIAGTIGYMAPEYAMKGYLTYKADVYSFGVVMLEIISGMSNTKYKPRDDLVYLLDWAYVLKEEGNLLELVDPNLGSDYSKEEALEMLNLSLVCTNPSLTLRPPMSVVLSMLEGKIPVGLQPVNREATKNVHLSFKAVQDFPHDSQTRSMSIEGPSFDTSFSLPSGLDDRSSEIKLLSD